MHTGVAEVPKFASFEEILPAGAKDVNVMRYFTFFSDIRVPSEDF